MLCGVRDRNTAALGDPEEGERAVDHGGIDDVGEIGHPGLEGDADVLPVGQAAAPLVVADQPMSVRKRRQPMSPHRAVPFQIQVGQPVRRLHQRAARFPIRRTRSGCRRRPCRIGCVVLRRPPARRGRTERLDRFDGRHELVPPPVDRADHRLAMPVVADRAACGLDPARQRGLADEPITPHIVEQFVLRHHPIPMGDQVDEHIEHAGLHVDRFVTAPKLEAHQVERILSETNDAVVCLGSRATGCRHLHPRTPPAAHHRASAPAPPVDCRERQSPCGRRAASATYGATVETVLRTVDGRSIGVAEFGDPDGTAVLWCHGGPGSRLEPAWLDAAATEAMLRIVGVDRPGYGLSTPRPGRTITSVVADMLDVADQISIDRFATVGVSTGGVYALALAALAPDRVLGVVACCSMTDMSWSPGRATMSPPHAHAVWDAPDRDAAIAAATNAHGENGSKMSGAGIAPALADLGHSPPTHRGHRAGCRARPARRPRSLQHRSLRDSVVVTPARAPVKIESFVV